MTGPYRDAAREGCLILVSHCPVELARFEALTRRWSIVSVLLGPLALEDIVAMAAGEARTVVAGLDEDASASVLALRDRAMRTIGGLCLVADDIRILRRSAVEGYHGDLVLLTPADPPPALLAESRRRFSGLRHVVREGPDRVRQALRDLVDRSAAGPAPGRPIPIVGWR